MSINNSIVCHANDTDHIDVLAVCTYSFISAMGLVFNLVALVVFLCQKKDLRRSHTIVYMTNLAISDTLLVLTLPMRIYYHLGFDDLPQWLCDALGLVLKANMYGSIFLLTCICLDRCLAVRFPMSPWVQAGREKAPLVCLGIWVVTFGVSLPIYFFSRPEVKDKECFDNLPVYALQPRAVYPTLFVGFGAPLVTMLICSWVMVRTVQRSSAAQSDLVDIDKIRRMIAASLLIFVLSFLPYHVILGLLLQRISCGMLAAYRYSLMVACLNTVLDPIAYYFTTETFKKNVVTVQQMIPLNSLTV